MACRICTANDRDALIEELAAEFWNEARGGTIDDRPWPEAGGYWQPIYRRFAESALTTMERGR